MGSLGHEHDFCQAGKAENTDPRTYYAVKYAAVRGHLTCAVFARFLGVHSRACSAKRTSN